MGQVIDPGFLRLLAHTHTAIVAVDAELNALAEWLGLDVYAVPVGES